MFRRVNEFGQTYANTFAETSLGKKIFTQITDLVADLETQSANQVSGRSSAQNIAATKETLRDEINDMLSAMNRTARVMEVDSPEFEAKFRLARRPTDSELLTVARSFLQDATPLKDHFIEHEFPADFLDRLSRLIQSFDQATSQKSVAVGSHVSTRLTIGEQVGRGTKLVRKLGAIIHNKFQDDPIALAAWVRAKHVTKRTRTEDAPDDKGPKPPEDESKS
jgi:hypothetical protein